jgi:hypothetical protein
VLPPDTDSAEYASKPPAPPPAFDPPPPPATTSRSIVAGGRVAIGVTELLAELAAEVPFAFVAVTVKV